MEPSTRLALSARLHLHRSARSSALLQFTTKLCVFIQIDSIIAPLAVIFRLIA
jgi:hypothetical protein